MSNDNVKIISRKRKKTNYSLYFGEDNTTKYNPNSIFRNTLNQKDFEIFENKKNKNYDNLSFKFHSDSSNSNSLNKFNSTKNKKTIFDFKEDEFKIYIADSINLSTPKLNNYENKKEDKIENEENIFFKKINKKNKIKSDLLCECYKYDNKYLNKICKSNWGNFLTEIPEDIELIYSLKYEQYNSEDLIQIERDLPRTTKNEKISNKLKKILLSVSASKRKIGYVQGMNYIAFSLLYHMEEEYVFYFILFLIKELNLDSIYKKGMQGTNEHIKMLKIIFKEKFIEFDTFLVKNDIPYEYFLVDWIVTLGTNKIPVNKNIILFQGLLENGWTFFYDFILNYYKTIFPLIIENQDFLKKTSNKTINWNKIFN